MADDKQLRALLLGHLRHHPHSARELEGALRLPACPERRALLQWLLETNRTEWGLFPCVWMQDTPETLALDAKLRRDTNGTWRALHSELCVYLGRADGWDPAEVVYVSIGPEMYNFWRHGTANDQQVLNRPWDGRTDCTFQPLAAWMPADIPECIVERAPLEEEARALRLRGGTF